MFFHSELFICWFEEHVSFFFFFLSSSFVLFFFSYFIHFCCLFIQSCFPLHTIFIMIVYCLLYFPANYHSLMLIYAFTHLCLFIIVCSCFPTISCSCSFMFACCHSPLLTHYKLLFIIQIPSKHALVCYSCFGFTLVCPLAPVFACANLGMGSLRDLRFKA
jgi:hypothetical protein